MNREYHKWYSPALGRDMELLVFGHGGLPLLVFPTSMGRFFEYENNGMIEVIRDRFENGSLQAYCVDSVDRESWYNRRAHPADKVRRHMQYDNYVVQEVVPFIKWKNWTPGLLATGCSFGGYHALNFSLKHPDIATAMISMSGAFDIHQFMRGYHDENVYFNCPTDFLPNLSDGWLLDRIRSQRIVLGTSDWDICLGANQRMDGIMSAKGIPHWLDIWGNHSKHDWPLWRQMSIKHIHA